MKRPALKWLVAGVVLVLLAGGVLRALSVRKDQREAVAAASLAKTESVIELAATDVVPAAVVDLVRGLPLSGALRAVNSALVKARAVGELQGLTVREGDRVQAGQVIARIDPTEYQHRVRQAQEQADAARVQIDIAQRQWTNNQALVDQGFISKAALDTSQNNLAGAQSTHKAALAAVDLARKMLDDTVMRTPISGVVAQRLAQPGERMALDARVVEIVDLSRLEMEATLSAADSMQVRVGQSATLQIEGSARPVAATVARINPSAQAGSRSVLAYLAIADASGLRQGLYAQGTLAIGHGAELAVPLTAVRTDKPAPYVQVVENSRIVHKPVQTGAQGESGKEALVAVKGLAPGALVVRGNLGSLREGTAVKFTPMAVPVVPVTPAAPVRSPSP
ncbi:efflux RND transporter periplasmic adaptor subunit [uncultured Ramlibacter sp.]|uniref:efflux RND transporter periplasmic adaptor subunit n=1 Tax=uncultured Ramlibacter sp. TaxID=260755 RepID=UPI002620664D|nr:efflux RND transporter periplasmic adaptor subunit [uncultured Ramlibacter sp.]